MDSWMNSWMDSWMAVHPGCAVVLGRSVWNLVPPGGQLGTAQASHFLRSVFLKGHIYHQ